LTPAEFREISNKLAEINTKVTSLVGNGQPGKITLIESRLADLEVWKAKALGSISAIMVIIGMMWKIADFLFQSYRR
jgi:hypothetical protein